MQGAAARRPLLYFNRKVLAMPNTRKRVHIAGLGMAAIAAFLMVASTADAQPNYMATYNAAQDEYNRAAGTGDYSKAKKLFLKAIKINSTRSGAYRYLTLIAERQKDWKACLKRALEFAKLNIKSKHIDTVRKLHTKCRTGLNYPEFTGQYDGRGAIHVSSTPNSAKVKFEGLALGATPLGPRTVNTGKAEVEVSADGYLSAKATAEVVEGFVTDVHFDLKKDPNAVVKNGNKQPTPGEIKTGWVTIKVTPSSARLTLDGKAPKTDENGRIETTPGMHVAMLEADGYEGWGRRVRIAKGQHRVINVTLRSTTSRQADRKKGYLALGGALVLGALGVTFGILEGQAFEEARDIFDAESTRPGGGDSNALIPIRTREDLADATSRGDTYKLLHMASLGAAAVALGVSIYYFVKERPAERKGGPLPVAITPLLPTSDGIAGVGAQLTYSTRLDW